MANPLISVLIPCYNAAPWLRAAMDSVSNQSNSRLQIIVYDDGSTDGSARLLREISRGDKRVVIAGESTNLGIVHALNAMLDIAQGQYVARMDSDDVCAPGRFSRQVKFLEENKLDFCGSWFVEFGQGVPRKVRWPHTEPAVRAAMIFQNAFCHPTIMAKREVFERYRYREAYSLVEDYDLFGRALADFRAANIPEALLRYRRHPGQATQCKRDAMESLTRRVRIEALEAQRISATAEEQRVHNLIRAPASIRREADLDGIESWLLKLLDIYKCQEARQVIALQWVRACVRAAPLGSIMMKKYLASPLRRLSGATMTTTFDLGILATTRMDYSSSPFRALRRLGLSG